MDLSVYYVTSTKKNLNKYLLLNKYLFYYMLHLFC